MMSFGEAKALKDATAEIEQLKARVTVLELALRQFRDASTRGRKPQWLKTLDGETDDDARQTAL